MTSRLPPLSTYSAAESVSSIVADRPRLSSTGLRILPSSSSIMKFCMLRAPTWSTSAHSATVSASRTSSTSVTTGRSTESPAARSSLRPSSPMPWNAYGLVRGLYAPPRSIVAPAAAASRATRHHLLLGLDRARAGHHGERSPADRRAPDADDGVFGLELTRHELVGLEDADDFLDAGQALEVERVDDLALADDADDRLDLTLGQVRLGTGLVKEFDDVVDRSPGTRGPS